MLHFAYGSNLLLSRIQLPQRAPSARPVAIASLQGWRLTFEKSGTDGSGKATVGPAHAMDRVYGVLYDIPAREALSLDDAEGPDYGRQHVEVQTLEGRLSVWLYMAKEHALDPLAVPFSWYRELVVAGARQNRFPTAYVDYLASVDAVEDADVERANRMFSLIYRKS